MVIRATLVSCPEVFRTTGLILSTPMKSKWTTRMTGRLPNLFTGAALSRLYIGIPIVSMQSIQHLLPQNKLTLGKTMKISNVRRSISRHAAIAGPAINLKGGIQSATFTCTCGETWDATATNRNVGVGYFALTNSSITVICQHCKTAMEGQRRGLQKFMMGVLPCVQPPASG